jgi:hypothetical protein
MYAGIVGSLTQNFQRKNGQSFHRSRKGGVLMCPYLVDNSGNCLFRIAASPMMAGADRHFLRLLLLAVISSTPAKL